MIKRDPMPQFFADWLDSLTQDQALDMWDYLSTYDDREITDAIGGIVIPIAKEHEILLPPEEELCCY